MKSQGISREWSIASIDYARTSELAKGLNVPPMVAHLLMRRGVRTVDEGERFLSPSLDHLCDPYSLRDMDRAVERIRLARDRGEHVVVFGDYDVDGIASTAILIRALQRYGLKECIFALPGRLVDGYGLGPQHVEEAHRHGASLIVTVDNGITAHDAAVEAKRLGVDLVITDHHAFVGDLPDAVAVVNPKREEDGHPASYASGAAIAFKLACALTGEQHDLDIAALGLIADIVPLRGENRDLVAWGLRQLKTRPCPGLLKLVQMVGLTLDAVTSEDIAFQLAPRINADGRLGTGMAGIQLLLTEDPSEAAQLAAQLDGANRERRLIESQILEEAIAEFERTHDPDCRAIVLAGKEWHPGVIGIVASRLKSRYGRPVIMLSVNGEGLARGSARTVDGLDLMAVLQDCRHHLVSFGGHYTAAGVTLTSDAIDAFRSAFDQEAGRRAPEGGFKERIEIDGLVSLSQIDVRFVKALELLQPFGCGNPSPIFASCGVAPLHESLKELNGGHLRFSVKAGPRVASAIAFGMGDRLPELSLLDACDIAFNPRLKTYRGETSIQLVIKDVRPCPDDDTPDEPDI